MEYDIQSLLWLLWKKIWLILLCCIIAASVAFCITKFAIVPQYSAKVSLLVTDKKIDVGETYSNYNVSYAERLVCTYMEILNSDTVLEKVASDVGLGYDDDEIRHMMKLSSASNTEIFYVTITGPNPAHCRIIANAIAKVAPDAIRQKAKVGYVEVVDYAKYPKTPISPVLSTNLLIAILLGLAISIATIIILDMMDVTIRDVEYLNENFNYPVLGVIPELKDNK